MLAKVWDLINGHKTDLVALGLGVVAFLVWRGFQLPSWIGYALLALGFAALRDALRKLE